MNEASNRGHGLGKLSVAFALPRMRAQQTGECREVADESVCQICHRQEATWSGIDEAVPTDRLPCIRRGYLGKRPVVRLSTRPPAHSEKVTLAD